MTATTSLYAMTFDCVNAARVADFWAAVLDRKVDRDATEEFASIGMAENSRPVWMFNKVPEKKKAKNRVHVDLLSDDRDDEVKRLLALGATKVADIDEGDGQWTTMTDPEGNEFDVVAGGQ